MAACVALEVSSAPVIEPATGSATKGQAVAAKPIEIQQNTAKIELFLVVLI